MIQSSYCHRVSRLAALALVMIGGVVSAAHADTQTRTRTMAFYQPPYVPSNPTTALVGLEVSEPTNAGLVLNTGFNYDAHGNRTGTSVSGGSLNGRQTTTT